MKVFIPKNIEKSLFGSTFQIGPFTVSMIQLFIISVGVGLALGLWGKLTQAGLDRFSAAILVLPLILITIFVAFFKISELALIPFLAKIIKTYFLELTKRYYTPFVEVLKYEVIIKKSKIVETEKKIDTKVFKLEKEKLKKLKKFSF